MGAMIIITSVLIRFTKGKPLHGQRKVTRNNFIYLMPFIGQRYLIKFSIFPNSLTTGEVLVFGLHDTTYLKVSLDNGKLIITNNLNGRHFVAKSRLPKKRWSTIAIEQKWVSYNHRAISIAGLLFFYFKNPSVYTIKVNEKKNWNWRPKAAKRVEAVEVFAAKIKYGSIGNVMLKELYVKTS